MKTSSGSADEDESEESDETEIGGKTEILKQEKVEKTEKVQKNSKELSEKIGKRNENCAENSEEKSSLDIPNDKVIIMDNLTTVKTEMKCKEEKEENQ